MTLYPLLLTDTELTALRDTLFLVERPDPTIQDIRKRLIAMQVEAGMEPTRRAMEKLEEQLNALRRRMPP